MSMSLKGRIQIIVQHVFPGLWEYMRHAKADFREKRRSLKYWQPRIKEVMSCPDNSRVPRQRDAGRIRGGLQVMHNGLLVHTDEFYGHGMTELLRKNKGCHEPQEELVFAAVIKNLAQGATMLELGAYWGFYSMWMARDVPGSRVWLIEPDARNIAVGKKNFDLNRLQGDFTQAFVGERTTKDNPPQVCVDDFLLQHDIQFLNVLHSDIQGAEADMLRGASKALAEQRVDYLFVSTHGEDLHGECIEILQRHNYKTAVSVNLADTYSADGIIVAQAPKVSNILLPLPHLKTSA